MGKRAAVAAALILLENSEYNLYRIEREVREHFSELSLHAHLADITDVVACDRLFAKYHPQVVFHAAAYKHVPMLETQVREAVKNNILGTKNVAEAADASGAERFPPPEFETGYVQPPTPTGPVAHRYDSSRRAPNSRRRHSPTVSRTRTQRHT